MQIVFSLFESANPDLIFPNQLIGWLGWLLMACLLVWGTWRERESLAALRERWWLAIALLAAGLITAAFLGLFLPGEVQPLPGIPMVNNPPVLMFLASLPMALAAGLLGTLPAVVLGVVQGLLIGLYNTHSPFTMLETGLVALLFGMAVRQKYRTLPYHVLRHPLAAALVVGLAYFPALIFSALFAANDTMAVRLDYAFTQTWLPFLARAGELLIAGLIAEGVYLGASSAWGRKGPLVPSPSESNIEARFAYGIAPLVAMLVLSLVIGDWLVAGKAARQMIRDQLSSTAEVAAESLPYFLETGQNLILTYSTPDLIGLTQAEQVEALKKRIRSVPYFNQLYLFDQNGTILAGHPALELEKISPSGEERSGIELALMGVSTQVYVVEPMVGETSAQVSFLSVIRGEQDEVWGRGPLVPGT